MIDLMINRIKIKTNWKRFEEKEKFWRESFIENPKQKLERIDLSP
jgi:hypothetical protein